MLLLRNSFKLVSSLCPFFILKYQYTRFQGSSCLFSSAAPQTGYCFPQEIMSLGQETISLGVVCQYFTQYDLYNVTIYEN